jgi:hypothetical protein
MTTTTMLRIRFLLAAVTLGSNLVNAFTAARPLWDRRQQQQFFSATTATKLKATSSNNADFALLFDCDGVILETEELHRLAYNEAFRKFELTIHGEPVEWSVRVWCL